MRGDIRLNSNIAIDGHADVLSKLSGPSVTWLFGIGNLRTLSAIGTSVLSALAPPSIETRQRGSPHSRPRDRSPKSHDHHLSNDLCEMMLEPSMTQFSAVFQFLEDSLDVAQQKELIVSDESLT